MDHSNSATCGKIELLYGCMFGGKTEELLRRLKSAASNDVQAFKHARDTRYGAREIVSHAGARFPAIPVTNARELQDRLRPDARIIALDEGHFFDPELPELCCRLRGEGRRLIITALQPNSWGIPFAIVDRLIELADVAELIFARCAQCGRQADRTQRTTPVQNGQIVGGPESFEPRCRDCWRPPHGQSVD